MPGLDAILSRNGDHASGSKVMTVGVELTWRASVPAATKEEHDCRTLVGRGVIRGGEDMDLQIRLADLLVNDSFVRREAFYFESQPGNRDQQEKHNSVKKFHLILPLHNY